MDRVLVGATVGALIGGLLGSLASNLDATFQLNNFGPGGGMQVVSLSRVIGTLGIVIGAGSGGIIGAIAGAVSARSDTRQMPVWFWWLVIGLVVLVLVIGLFGWVMYSRPLKSKDPGQLDLAPMRVPEKAENMPGPEAPAK
ncbi:MAG TPA: hypothetical protein VKE94_02600 [Gemmataceae bacterium]|nr:hypothetical protein [Gemmataceae bacterium]